PNAAYRPGASRAEPCSTRSAEAVPPDSQPPATDAATSASTCPPTTSTCHSRRASHRHRYWTVSPHDRRPPLPDPPRRPVPAPRQRRLGVSRTRLPSPHHRAEHQRSRGDRMNRALAAILTGTRLLAFGLLVVALGVGG